METSSGIIEIKLFAKEAPKTVNNFVYLSKEGYYDGTIFHRVIKDFMIQGGDPKGTGTGGPGYEFEDEINKIKLTQGKLAMANRGKNTNGSQFFIVTAKETPWLDGKHTVFGEVTKGLDVVLKIGKEEVGLGDKPVVDATIEKITISD
ncbi:MAG: peptidylprolyl isomerase [Actinobacteria bacterium]|nr:MAG: peptidylprolyl isomerase [Actinomycetota bacterium]